MKDSVLKKVSTKVVLVHKAWVWRYCAGAEPRFGNWRALVTRCVRSANSLPLVKGRARVGFAVYLIKLGKTHWSEFYES